MSAVETKRKRTVPELRVVFDTSVLYTGSASDLVQGEVAAVIKEHSQHPDLAITWYLPHVVRHERQFQMQRKGMDLLPHVQKLERLLGHRLNITEPIIEQRVNAAVETQLAELGLATLELDPTRVDWGRLILDACYRQPPFEDGESERGFRDSLIAEAFLQLVEASPKTSKTCRVILVTGDKLLADAVRTRTSDESNVRIVASLEELKGLISTLVEQVTEQFVETYAAKAKSYFSEKGQEECLFYKMNIRNSIMEDFKDALESVPEGAEQRVNLAWSVAGPRFVKKQRQRVYWATRISRNAEAYKTWAKPVPSLGEYFTTGHFILERSALANMDLGDTPKAGRVNLSDMAIKDLHVGDILERELVSRGKSVFEVVWSVIIKTTGQFTSPRIESIEHVSTNWE